MKIGFVINALGTEDPRYTTTRLAVAALRRGHEAWVLEVGDFVYDPDGSVHGNARHAPKERYEELDDYMGDLRSDRARRVRIAFDELDVLFLRNDPAADAAERPWAQSAAILFGQLAAARGALVVNDPGNLADAVNKTYFQHFPEKARPRTCISRNPDEIKAFVAAQDGRAVIKPLQGSGGHNVFLVTPDERKNINQMIEAVMRDGYVIAQEYLPAAEKGDVRVFVLNGEPLVREGKAACFRRMNESGDARSNMHVGGKVHEAELDEATIELVRLVRPKLIHDGMYLVGLDVVGDKLMEINVFSPGGLGSASALAKVDFADAVVEDLERKMDLRAHYGGSLSNAQLATL